MPTIATMFNSRLPSHSMAGYTTKPYRERIVSLDFPTNGQAKELPIATWVRLWRDAPRTIPQFSANTWPVYPLPGSIT